MTDKQIMIDGVDVADCEHINACDKKIKCVILQDDVCETNPYCEGFNCYFKQLARKTQECEQAEQKLERIKEMLKKCVKIHDDIIVNKSILQIIDEVEK